MTLPRQQVRGRRLVLAGLAVLPLLAACEQQDAPQSRPNIETSVRVERVPVRSTNLHSVGYDSTTRLLTIEFQNGSVYDFEDVPQELHAELMKAESHGKFFHSRIRNAGFRGRRIR